MENLSLSDQLFTLIFGMLFVCFHRRFAEWNIRFYGWILGREPKASYYKFGFLVAGWFLVILSLTQIFFAIRYGV